MATPAAALPPEGGTPTPCRWASHGSTHPTSGFWKRWFCTLLACAWLISGWMASASAQTPVPADEQFGDPESVSRSFDEILSKPEFRRLRSKAPQIPDTETPGWLKRFFNWLGDLLQGSGNAAAGVGSLLQVLAYAVLAAIGCLIIWLVIRAVNAYRGRQTVAKKRRDYEEGEGEIPPGDLPADEYLRRAAELAEKGRFREAIAHLILGAMSRTERSGLIRFRRGLTHRDYLRALRRRSTQHQALQTIVDVYEPICFGRRPAQYDHYRVSLEGYMAGFQEVVAHATAAAASLPAPAPAVTPNDEQVNDGRIGGSSK